MTPIVDELESRRWPLCVYCGRPAPKINLEGDLLHFVLDRNARQSAYVAIRETMLWAKCSEEEASLFNEHLRECAYAWPLDEEDMAVIAMIDRAFAYAERPDQFTKRDFCWECKEIDDFLQQFTRTSLPSRAGSSGLYHWNAAAGAYYLPTLARFILRPMLPVWGLADDILSRLLMEGEPWIAAFTSEQRIACRELLRRELGKGHSRKYARTPEEHVRAIEQIAP